MNFIFTNILLSIVYEDDNLWFICGHVDICMGSTAANFTVNNNIEQNFAIQYTYIGIILQIQKELKPTATFY
jgi:hypothetical protein